MEIVVFGTGTAAKSHIVKIESRFHISFCVDNDKEKWGKSFSGYEIQSPEVLDYHSDQYYIFVLVFNEEYKREIAIQLNDMGYQYGRHFSFIGSVSPTNGAPGKVSGYISAPGGLSDIKSFDPASRLFFTKQKQIFRVVNPEYRDAYRSVLQKCEKADLLGTFIVDTKDVSGQVEGFPNHLVLEHEFIEPITYAYEWSPSMFLDYVDFMLRFQVSLANAGLGLQDGHILNATISHGNFLFIDFGAISDKVESAASLAEFFDTHILPLIMIKKGQIQKAYMLMHATGISFCLTDVSGYLNETEMAVANKVYRHIWGTRTFQDVLDIVNEIKAFVAEIPIYYERSIWSGYQDDEWNWAKDESQWSTKMRNVIELEKKANPSTVLDIAGNMGWYGSFLHNQFRYASILDVDYSSIDNLWKRLHEQGINNVLPVYMSFCSPTTDYYRDDAIGETAIVPWRRNAIYRLRSELVIALAIVHHLVFRQQLTFEEIIGQIQLFCEKYLIIEFVEKEDPYITDFKTEGFEWYTKDAFENVLQTRFSILEKKPSTPEETRTIYFCQMK